MEQQGNNQHETPADATELRWQAVSERIAALATLQAFGVVCDPSDSRDPKAIIEFLREKGYEI
ncbi:MAG TPA: hypothetical protein VFQ70_04015 [Candidatus Saccharimonadaceae bacterium]|nr:hypothetical protein [Candidatus Saccharimonadaceae bacterium]